VCESHPKASAVRIHAMAGNRSSASLRGAGGKSRRVATNGASGRFELGSSNSTLISQFPWTVNPRHHARKGARQQQVKASPSWCAYNPPSLRLWMLGLRVKMLSCLALKPFAVSSSRHSQYRRQSSREPEKLDRRLSTRPSCSWTAPARTGEAVLRAAAFQQLPSDYVYLHRELCSWTVCVSTIDHQGTGRELWAEVGDGMKG
jgi:hypothetical protein